MSYKIFKLKTVVQDYAWGTFNFIPQLMKYQSSSEHQAECWMGTHQDGMSRREEDEQSLLEIIQADPSFYLGEPDASEGLSFLFKILSAAKPLSIQAHPNKLQARQGYEQEDLCGVPLSSPRRNYKDKNHKPELICALTPFYGMKGFRLAEDIFSCFTKIPLPPSLEEVCHLSLDDPQWIQAFYSTLWNLKAEEKQTILENALRVFPANNNLSSYAYWLHRCAELYPNDIGALAPLYLNVFHLEPLEALYLEAGTVHAYLEGSGIELMANSNNVLRGGLTSKHIDVPELLKIGDYKSTDIRHLLPYAVQDSCWKSYEIPIDEFKLYHFQGILEDKHMPLNPLSSHAKIFIITEGHFIVQDEDESILCEQGSVLFVAAKANHLNIKGEGQIFCATTPRKN